MEPRASTWPEGRLQRAVLVVARVALGYLFFTQLFWKLPPQFGCPPTSPSPRVRLPR